MSQSKILIIAYYTFKEILKSRLLWSVFLIGLSLVLVTYIATEFTYGVPEKIALDFGLGMLSLSSLGISLFLGVTLLSKEIDSRTVYMVISRPVSRSSFILGKVLGLMLFQFLDVLLLSTITLGAVSFLEGEITGLVFWTIGFILLECLLLLLVVVLLSLMTNTILSTLISIALLVLGHAIKETQNVSFVKNREILKVILDFYHFILPGFYKLNLKDYVIYKSSLPIEYLLSSVAYGLMYSGFLLCLIIVIFNKKNLD